MIPNLQAHVIQLEKQIEITCSFKIKTDHLRPNPHGKTLGSQDQVQTKTLGSWEESRPWLYGAQTMSRPRLWKVETTSRQRLIGVKTKSRPRLWESRPSPRSRLYGAYSKSTQRLGGLLQYNVVPTFKTKEAFSIKRWNIFKKQEKSSWLNSTVAG